MVESCLPSDSAKDHPSIKIKMTERRNILYKCHVEGCKLEDRAVSKEYTRGNEIHDVVWWNSHHQKVLAQGLLQVYDNYECLVFTSALAKGHYQVDFNSVC